MSKADDSVMEDYSRSAWCFYALEAGKVVISDGLGQVAQIYEPVEGSQYGNAWRICACVNACSGISTEALQQASLRQVTLKSRVDGPINSGRLVLDASREVNKSDELANALAQMADAVASLEQSWMAPNEKQEVQPC